MSLHYVPANILPQVWPTVAPMLQKAIDLDPSEISIDQVEYFLRIGKNFLLIWDEQGKGITGAATVEFIDYPKQRVVHVNLMGGSGIVRDHVFAEAKAWMKNMGATTAQCWAKGTLVDMYKKMGLENTHQVMRIDL